MTAQGKTRGKGPFVFKEGFAWPERIRVQDNEVGDPNLYVVNIVDENEKPVWNAAVTLNRLFQEGNKTRVEKMSSRTNGKGVASFMLSAPGQKAKEEFSWVLSCDAPGMDLAFASAPIDEDADLTMLLRKCDSMTGKVVDADGKPVPGVAIG